MNLNNYEILNKLGEGAFGVVYKARDKTNNTICVIKKIDMTKMSQKMRKNAMQQGKILKQLNSPYIVKHFHTFAQKSHLNIVMQYCPKGDLTAFLKAQVGKPLKQDVIWKISIQMMIGLRDIHAKKILHRDMKSLNIFLDADRNIRIGDLGVAKALKADFAYTIVGTPYYLSPEMCEEKPYNQKTDIWAMGCIIYQLCTGKHPFEANNQAALALKIVIGKYENIPNHYSSDLSWVVKSCLSVDYKRRPTAAYLLAKPNILQKANKLGIIIDYGSHSIEKKISEDSCKSQAKVQQKKIEEKKIDAMKTPNLPKKQIVQKTPQIVKKIGQPRKSVEKKVQLQIKEKEKKIQIPKPRLPPKKQALPINLDNKAKKYSGAKLLQMKQKQKMGHSRCVSQLQNTQRKQSKAQIIGQKNQKQQARYVSVKPHPQKNNEKLNMTMNRFLPEDFRKRKQFDEEDERHKYDKVQIPDSSSDSSTEKQPKGDKRIFQHAQQVVDDNQLMQQFGIPAKKQEPQKISSMKLDNAVKEINWDALDSQDTSPKSVDQQKNKIEDKIIENDSITIKQPNLPTIKTPSYLEMEPLLQMKMQDDNDDKQNQNEQEEQQNLLEEEQEEEIVFVNEQIEENQAYISDDEQDTHVISNKSRHIQNKSKVHGLIEDYPEKSQKLVRKLEENKKRQKQLQKMKEHFESELLKIIPNHQQYQNIKLQLINGDDDAVEKFVNKWKGNIQSINLFYRIVHLEMELKRCYQNISTIQNNLSQVRKTIASQLK